MLFRIGVNVGDVMFKEGDISVMASMSLLARGPGQGRGELRFAGCARSPPPSRRDGLRGSRRAAGKNIAHPIRALAPHRRRSVEQEATFGEDRVTRSAFRSAATSEFSADNEVALEFALWDSVRDGSPAELNPTSQYPEGTFASLAQTRLEAAALSPKSATPTPEEVAAEALDFALWNSVKDSDRREELDALEQHPNGHFAGLHALVSLRQTVLSAI